MSERETRYAEAIYVGAEAVDPDERAEVTSAVMAVADAEQADLRAEIERLRRESATRLEWFEAADEAAERRLDLNIKYLDRAEAAEAQVAAVRAMADDLDAQGVTHAGDSDTDSGLRYGIREAARRLRAALSSPEPVSHE